MILRSAGPDDASAITALEKTLFGPDAWAVSSVIVELSGADRFSLVATEGDAVLGYAITMRSGDVVDLQRIGVRPSRQRRGVARALLVATTDWAVAEGFGQMLLEVGARNRVALTFYVGAGFVEIDRRRRYYRDGSDAVVMRRPLRRSPQREWVGQ